MPPPYNRTDLQKLSSARLRDAVILLENRRYSGAFYISGYSVELGLKACIAKQFIVDSIPDKNFVNAIYQHNLENLVGLAGLRQALNERMGQDENFGTNWGIVAQWNESSRYEATDRFTSQVMISSIIHRRSGVFQWIKAHW